MAYDIGDFNASLRCGDEGDRLRRLRGPQGQGQVGRQKLRGIGVSCYIEACGIAPSKAV